MNIRPLRIPGAFEISLSPRGDERGHFMRTYDREIFRDQGLQTEWIQENQSLSRAIHTIRGLHFQRPPAAETKLVRVATGAVLDVFVDLRRGSPTFGQWESVEVSAEKQNMVYVPKGLAHGFCTLTPDVLMLYKVDHAYAPELEMAIRWDDPSLGIAWPAADPIVSEKDKMAVRFSELVSPFQYEKSL
jgi:dTDP-4-dehydrorhamnose 3,5-epimerase